MTVSSAKNKSISEIAAIAEQLRAQGKRIVFTNGCFDILHVGHLYCLQQAGAQGDVLIVGVNSDSSVRALKGPERPLVPEEQRLLLLAALEPVSYVVPFSDLRPDNVIRAVRPHVHVKGGDYRADDLPEAPLVRELGGEIVIIPLVQGLSTTNIIGRARNERTDAAAAFPRVEQVVAFIPARFASTRLPGKPLRDLAGKPMIQHVYERAREASSVNDVVVATDDQRIFDVVESFRGKVVMTSADHASGTDRVAEAARVVQCDIAVNVQGDEPMLDPASIDAAVTPLLQDPELKMATLMTPITDPEERADPNAVKVVTDGEGFALYFSRSPLPCWRGGAPMGVLGYKHLGLYAYRSDFLQTYAKLPRTRLEEAEKLEQLRVLEHGYRIKVVETTHDAVGVDTEEDLARAREALRRRMVVP